MKHITKMIAVLGLGGLVLSGCAANPQESGPEENPEQTIEVEANKKVSLNQVFYAKTPHGAEITIDFGAELPKNTELLREAVGGDPVSYAKAFVDNRNGVDSAGVYKVVVFDEDGKSYEYTGMDDHLSNWQVYQNYDSENPHYMLPDGSPITEAQYDVLQGQYQNLEETYNEKDANARVHEVSESYIAYGGVDIPEEIVAIEVWPGGIIEDPIYMVPQGEKDSYEVAKDSGEKPAEQTDAEAEKEYNEWVAGGSDCSDEVLAELGQKTVVAVAFECAFAEEAETSAAPAVEPSGQAIGPPPGQAHDVGTVQDEKYTYDEAYAAWQNGESYYSAFCVNYVPVTEGGVSQCEGIEDGTVDFATGEYIG